MIEVQQATASMSPIERVQAGFYLGPDEPDVIWNKLVGINELIGGLKKTEFHYSPHMPQGKIDAMESAKRLIIASMNIYSNQLNKTLPFGYHIQRLVHDSLMSTRPESEREPFCYDPS